MKFVESLKIVELIFRKFLQKNFNRWKKSSYNIKRY